LWGDRGEAQARDSLRQALSLVRKALSGVRVQPLIAQRHATGSPASTIQNRGHGMNWRDAALGMAGVTGAALRCFTESWFSGLWSGR
jgi:hypothetical protein